MGTLKSKGHLRVGTSGWQYRHWKGVFYPETVKQAGWLSYYCDNFQTVELNTSFYRQPAKKVFEHWRLKVPAGFTFAVKAPRYFTHLKKLLVTRSDLDAFFDAATGLGAKLGPMLFQLPPRWHVDLERMRVFLGRLPGNRRFTIEFRDSTWYTRGLYDLLHQFDIAFCIYELGGHKSPVISTASFVYIRLHGPGEKYRGSYTEADLRGWAGKIERYLDAGKDVYVFFDNDEAASAPKNAKDLLQLLSGI